MGNINVVKSGTRIIPPLVITEIYRPVLLTGLVQKHNAKNVGEMTPLQTMTLMRQGLTSVPTYLRAVKDGRGHYIAYLWAQILSGMAVAYHVVSLHPRATRLILNDYYKWLKNRGLQATTVIVPKFQEMKALGLMRWLKREGYTPQSVVYIKPLGGSSHGGSTPKGIQETDGTGTTPATGSDPVQHGRGKQ